MEANAGCSIGCLKGSGASSWCRGWERACCEEKKHRNLKARA